MSKVSTTLRQRAVRLTGACVDVHQDGGGRKRLLHNIDFSLQAGEWVAVVGENGSGKSTMAKAVSGLIPLSEGTRAVSPVSLSIGYVGQHTQDQFLGDTVTEERLLAAALRSVGNKLGGDAAHMAIHHTTQAGLVHSGEKCASVDPKTLLAHLSRTEAVSFAVETWIAAGVDVLVVDEATGGLDRGGRMTLCERLMTHQAARSLGVLWITHQWDEILHADRIAWLETGRIVFQGTPDELLRHLWEQKRSGRARFYLPFFLEAALSGASKRPPNAQTVQALLGDAACGVDL